jgi:hypothetical protein
VSEFILVLILIIVVLIYLNLSLKIVPIVQSQNLFRNNTSKRYAYVKFIVPQLKGESYLLAGNLETVNQPIKIGLLGLSRSFQVMAFCEVAELSKKKQYFEGNIVVTQYEHHAELAKNFEGDTVRFIVFDNNIFEFEIKCSPESFDELRRQCSANQDTTLDILEPYFKKQKTFKFLIGGTGVSVNSINFSGSYINSVYEAFLKQYQSSNDNIAHDSIYKTVNELMVIRRKSQTQLRAEAEGLGE